MLNKKRILSVLVLIIFALSLSMSSFAYYNLTFSYSPNLGQSWRTPASQVINDWKTVLGGNGNNSVRLLLSSREVAEDANDAYSTIKNYGFAQLSPHWANYAGVCMNGDININSAITGTNTNIFKAILAHEIGHALGLGHNESTGNIMNSVIKYGKTSPVGRITNAQVSLINSRVLFPAPYFQAAWGCWTGSEVDGPGRSGG